MVWKNYRQNGGSTTMFTRFDTIQECDRQQTDGQTPYDSKAIINNYLHHVHNNILHQLLNQQLSTLQHTSVLTCVTAIPRLASTSLSLSVCLSVCLSVFSLPQLRWRATSWWLTDLCTTSFLARLESIIHSSTWSADTVTVWSDNDTVSSVRLWNTTTTTRLDVDCHCQSLSRSHVKYNNDDTSWCRLCTVSH